METTRRAIGIVRVSQVNGREGESFASPGEQRDRIRAECEREGLRLVEIVEELDVSGGAALHERPGLGPAVEAIEAGRADVIAAAYFDRLFRSLTVQAEVVGRVERAGGQVLAVDVGRVTNGSAGQWLSGTMIGAVSEYQRRTAKERSGEAQARAVARGVWMSPYVPVGYTRGATGRLEPSGDEAAVVDAFAARAAGATVGEVRERLRGAGADMTYPAVTRLLKSRVYLGELHFGKLSNLSAHPAIVGADLWRAAQRTRPSPGRRANSERLLARLGVLRCGSCDGRMSATSGHNGTRPMYRCGAHVGDSCPQPVTISAELVEGLVVDRVRAALADVEGRASIEDNARGAAVDLERAQADLDAALRAFVGLEDEIAARDRLAELRELRDRAQEQVDHLGGGLRPAITISASADWDRLSLDARRALIRATVARVKVLPARGRPRHWSRVKVELVGE